MSGNYDEKMEGKIIFNKNILQKRNANSSMPLCLLKSHLIFTIDYESKDKH